MADSASDAAYVGVGPEQVSITVNWPVQSGAMADVCVAHRDHSTAEPLVCHRGPVTDLCQILLQAPSNFQHPGILHIHHIQLEPNSDMYLHQEKPADEVSSLQPHQGRASKSQQAEVKAMLKQMMSSGPPGCATAPADTHQKFLAALAKAALAQNKGQPSDTQQHEFVRPASVPMQSHAVVPPSVSAQPCQMQPASPLIQEVPGTHDEVLVDQALLEGYLQQEAGTAGTQAGQQHADLNDSDRYASSLFESRLQALEASSRRAERKIDQILEYCRTMAQAMSPA